jgi:hypothetical protein
MTISRGDRVLGQLLEAGVAAHQTPDALLVGVVGRPRFLGTEFPIAVGVLVDVALVRGRTAVSENHLRADVVRTWSP